MTERLNAEQSGQPAFCLVHGAWHGPWCWNYVTPELEQFGRQVITPKMPIDDPQADFNRYAHVVADEIIGSGAEEVTIVGHSRAGNVLPRVPQVLARRAGHIAVKKLIYVAAAIDTKTVGWLGSKAQELPDAKSLLYKVGISQIGTEEPLFNPELAKDTFYHDCADDVAAWAISLLRPQYRPDKQPVLKHLPKIPSYFVICVNDRVIPALDQAITAPYVYRIPASRIRYMKTGHMPMLAEPQLFADTLIELDEAA